MRCQGPVKDSVPREENSKIFLQLIRSIEFVARLSFGHFFTFRRWVKELGRQNSTEEVSAAYTRNLSEGTLLNSVLFLHDAQSRITEKKADLKSEAANVKKDLGRVKIIYEKYDLVPYSASWPTHTTLNSGCWKIFKH